MVTWYNSSIAINKTPPIPIPGKIARSFWKTSKVRVNLISCVMVFQSTDAMTERATLCILLDCIL